MSLKDQKADYTILHKKEKPPHGRAGIVQVHSIYPDHRFIPFSLSCGRYVTECFIRVNSWIALLGDLTDDPRIHTNQHEQ